MRGIHVFATRKEDVDGPDKPGHDAILWNFTMTLTLIDGPAEEPVTMDEARAHLRVDGTGDDALIAGLVTAARTMLEAETRRAFVSQGWQLTLDAWPETRRIDLPLAPVVSVEELAVDGTALDAALYDLGLRHDPPRIALKRNAALPAPDDAVGGIGVSFTAGYGEAAAVPQPLKQAVLMLTAHWYENRMAGGMEGGAAVLLPLGVQHLVAPYRRPRL
jgi:uncharacterized phiE125 gp8 family phage protein